jgi:hypothetical protein
MCALWDIILDLQSYTLIFAMPIDLGLEGQVCFEFRLLDLACLVKPSSTPLFWDRGIVLLLVDVLVLPLHEEFVSRLGL